MSAPFIVLLPVMYHFGTDPCFGYASWHAVHRQSSLAVADGWDAAPAPQPQQQFAATNDNFGAQY